MSKEKPETHTELNYQFLNTVSIREEFRPRDLPDGWDHSPEEDERNWLTKQTEVAYYNFLRQQDLPAGILSAADEPLGHPALSQKPGASAGRDPAQKSAHDRRTDLPAGAGRQSETDFEELLSGAFDRSRGQPLSLRRSDGLLSYLLETLPQKKRNKAFYDVTKSLRFKTSAFYAPGAAYQHGDTCTLAAQSPILREMRNCSSPPTMPRKKSGRCGISISGISPIWSWWTPPCWRRRRLGGADYDGDMVKTIADPIVNACVRRNYEASRGIADDALSNEANIPLLMIPSATPPDPQRRGLGSPV